jgi:hypothetical protein
MLDDGGETMKEGKFCGGCKKSVESESGGVVVAFG